MNAVFALTANRPKTVRSSMACFLSDILHRASAEIDGVGWEIMLFHYHRGSSGSLND